MKSKPYGFDEIKSVLYPPKSISSAKQISSTIVDLFRRKTDLVKKTINFILKLMVFMVGGTGLEPVTLCL